MNVLASSCALSSTHLRSSIEPVPSSICTCKFDVLSVTLRITPTNDTRFSSKLWTTNSPSCIIGLLSLICLIVTGVRLFLV